MNNALEIINEKKCDGKECQSKEKLTPLNGKKLCVNCIIKELRIISKEQQLEQLPLALN